MIPALTDVDCPFCGAGPLEPCTSMPGRYMEFSVHGARRIRSGVDFDAEPEPTREVVIRSTNSITCQAGLHAWTAGNIYTSPRGNHQCRPCRRENQRNARGAKFQNNGTHCRKGHEYTPENTYKAPGGGPRRCLTCKALQRKKGTK